MKRTPLKRSRKPIPSRSKRTKDEAAARAECRAAVIARAGRCEAQGIDGVPHGFIPGRAPLEVHELRRGQSRRLALALRPKAHPWAREL